MARDDHERRRALRTREEVVKVFIFLALTIGFGYMVGHSDSRVEVQKEKVEVVKSVEVPGPTITKNVLPTSCKRLIDLSKQRTDAAKSIDNHGAAQLDILSDARSELAGGQNASKLNLIETRQRQLLGQTVGNVLTISQTETEYKKVLVDCERDSK